MYKSTKAAFFLLSFLVVILVGLAYVRLRECPGLVRRSYHTIVLGDKDFIDKKVRFTIQGQGTRGLPNGLLGGFTTVRASDCVYVTVEAQDEGLPAQAEDEMEKKIQKATRVIERGPIIGPSGEPLGERAVLLEKEEPNAEIVVLHKGKRYVGLIQSTSLAHALALEKLTQNGYMLGADGYVVAPGQ